MLQDKFLLCFSPHQIIFKLQMAVTLPRDRIAGAHAGAMCIGGHRCHMQSQRQTFSGSTRQSPAAAGGRRRMFSRSPCVMQHPSPMGTCQLTRLPRSLLSTGKHYFTVRPSRTLSISLPTKTPSNKNSFTFLSFPKPPAFSFIDIDLNSTQKDALSKIHIS